MYICLSRIHDILDTSTSYVLYPPTLVYSVPPDKDWESGQVIHRGRVRC